MTWLNEPPRWSWQNGRLEIETGDGTDFWRETHYGFIHDNGHLFYQEVEGTFSATVRFQGQYDGLYDQAGLMIRLGELNWIKAGIEFTDGHLFLSVVVTNENSDWSVVPLPSPLEWVWLRLSRRGDAVKVEWSADGTVYQMLRLAYLPAGGKAMVGPMACSPLRAGFTATFENFEVAPVIDPFLH